MGLDAFGVNAIVYGPGVMVTVGAVVVYVIVSLAVSYTVELTCAVPVLAGIPSVRSPVSVTTMKRSCVTVYGTVT